MQYGATPNNMTSVPTGIPFRRYSTQNLLGAISPGRLNSLEHFASSYTRAQHFLVIEPPSEFARPRSYFVDEESQLQGGMSDDGTASVDPGSSQALPVGASQQPHSELLVNQDNVNMSGNTPAALTNSYHEDHASAVFDGSESDDNESAVTTEHSELLNKFNRDRRMSYLPTPEFGTIVLREAEAIAPEVDSEPIIVRDVEGKDGHIVTIVAGQSTAPQTIFNSVNVLVGVGLLSLSLGFKYSGWLIGLVMMCVAAGSTFYTAKLLAKCMDTDHTLVTYADIAYAAYGPRARILTSILFTLEISAAGVSMVVLFADSLNALLPQFSAYEYKIFSFFILTPLCFLPLSVLSISSVLGILSTLGLVLIVLFDGIYKQTAPGSLWEPMTTWLMPQNWMTVPLSIGIFMAPWGGHAVFPNIYRDMRHPNKYGKCLVTTYQITFLIDMSMAVLGFVMFGATISEEVTKSILLMPNGYPTSLGLIMTGLIAIIPLAKTPLSARPIVSTLDVLLGLDHVPLSVPSLYEIQHSLHWLDIFNRFVKLFLRVLVVFGFVLFAIIFPSFDRIIGLLGCSMCTIICVLGPIAFYLKIFSGQVSRAEYIICCLLFVVFSVLAVIGTVWCFLSEETISQGFSALMI